VKFAGSVIIEASRDKVWQSLTDPNLVSQCAPGLESMRIVEPDKQFNVVASVGFGSVKMTFDANVEWEELEAPDYARVKAHGKAPGNGVDVVSEMRLSDAPDGATQMDWNADVVLVGSMAGLASRLMGGITKKMSAAFFDCIKGKIEV
jgi:carbon monoxide dehydrogenase subunit G